jgi:hypothetical protein
VPTDEANPWDDDTSDAAPEPTTDEGRGEGQTQSAPEEAAEAGDVEEGEEDRRRVLIIAAVAFVIIAAAAFVLTRGGDDPADEAVIPGDTRTATGGAEGGGAITIAGTADSFNREETTDGLGALPSGAPWVVQSGTWAIRSDEAVVTQPEDQRRNTVYVATGYPDPMAQVRLTTIANGAGMVFRYQGECNFWAVYAVPEYATWNVEKIIDCERVGGEDSETVYRTITGAPVGEGTTVGVVLNGDQVQIVLNGTIALTFEDPDLAGVGRLGLTTRGDAPVAFDDFVAGGPGGQGIVGAATTPPGGEDGATTTAAEDGSSTTTTAAEGDGGG